MNEDAFARRFYADRAELESLGIQLTVDKPARRRRRAGELLAAPGELPPARRSRSPTRSSRALQTALSLLDGEFAYAEPLRLALQQISWGRPSPLERARAALGRARASPARPAATSSRSAWRRSRRRSSATRRSPSTTTRWSATRSARARSTRTTCSSRAASSTCSATRTSASALRVFRLSRIRGKVAYATKAEHDFQRPRDFDPRAYANRADWQFGDAVGTAEIWVSERIAWQVERHFGRFGEVAPRGRRRRRLRHRRTPTRASSSPGCCGLGEHARVVGPPELVAEVAERARAARASATRGPLELAAAAPPRRPATRTSPRRATATARRGARPRSAPSASRGSSRSRRSSSRPAAPASACGADDVCERLQISDAGAARGRQRPQRRQLRRRLLRALRRGRRRRRDRGRPRALLRQLRPPRAAAARRGQGAGRGDRPDRRPPARGLARRSAREKIVAALGADPMRAGPAGRRAPAATTPTIARVVSRGDRRAAGCCGSTTTSPTRTSSPSAPSSPTR